MKKTGRKSAIYHILPAKDWYTALENGSYQAPSLETEGFIHCSTLEQLIGTANLFFKNQTGLALLEINPDHLASTIQYDQIEDGRFFPHVYGPINLEAVVRVYPFEPGVGGTFILPASLKNE